MKSGYRIALVSAFPPGNQSLNEYGLHLAQNFAARDDVAEVVVLADILDAPQAELALSPKIRVRRCWRFNALSTPVNVLRALRSERPDGVLYNVQMATFGDRELPAGLGLVTPMLSRRFGFASGIIAHNLVSGVDLDRTILRGQRLRQAVVRAGAAAITRAMTGADYMTVTLRSYHEHLSGAYPRADVALVPHGSFCTADRPWQPVAGRPARIVTMGKFGTYKRLETLLGAFDILRRDPEFADHELVIGGTDHPNMAGYLDTLRAARRDDPGVRFHGYVAEDDVPAFFEGARLSVFDYDTTTGSSGVLHQAASYGAVPVFPRIDDFVDLCEDEGLRGHHYQPGDAASMARAMREGLGDVDGAESLALSNRDAAMGLPFSQVIGFHMARLTGAGDSAASQVART